MFKKYRFRTPTVLQMEATECGAACLAMILSYYGHRETLDILRDKCGVSRNGSKASLIIQVAKEYGLDAKGYQLHIKDLDKLKGPMILFWNFEHFVVYEGRSFDGKSYYLNDPAYGEVEVDSDTFETSFTGVALGFRPTEKFVVNSKRGLLRDSIYNVLLSVKNLWGTFFWYGFLLIFPGVIIPSLLQVLVDYVMQSHSGWRIPIISFFVITILLGVLLTLLVKIVVRRTVLILSLEKMISIFTYLFQLPIKFFWQRSICDLQNRIEQIHEIASGCIKLYSEIFLRMFISLFFLILMFCFSFKLTLLVLLLLLINIIFIMILMKKRSSSEQKVETAYTNFYSFVLDGIESVEDLKASGKDELLLQRWTDLLSSYNRLKLFSKIKTTIYRIFPDLLSLLGNIAILGLGSLLVISGSLTFGQLFGFMVLCIAFMAPFYKIAHNYHKLKILHDDINRLYDIYRYPCDPIFKLDADHLDSSVEQIKNYAELSFENVSFAYGYHEEPVIKNISFTLKPSKRVAIVGASGSGKSTIARLSAGLLSPISGTIKLNGIPLDHYSSCEFYSMVGIVEQNVMLFSGTITDNLSLFAPIHNASHFKQAISDAQIERELLSRGNPLKVQVTENGSNFSGGQCQRIELARVLSRNTPLVILDEATSALDPITEELVGKSLQRRGISQLIIAHRLSTVRDADEIIVLDQGTIAERGSFADLMAHNGLFKKMMDLEEGDQAC